MFVGGLAVLVLQLIGMGFCMAVPPQRNSVIKTLAIVAFSGVAAGVVLPIVSVVPRMMGGRFFEVVGSMINFLGTVGSIAGYVVFLFFLRSVALVLRDRLAAQAVVKLMIGLAIFAGSSVVLTGVMIGVGVALGASAFSSAMSGGSSSGLFSALAGFGIAWVIYLGFLVVTALVMFVWYIRVVQMIRDVVDRYLRRA